MDFVRQLALLLLSLLYTVDCQTQVDTLFGTVEGQRLDFGGRAYDQFLSIPFAKPPLGNLRWEKPEEPDIWQDVYMATEFKDPCVQLGVDESTEDCLHLSVYVPDGVENLNSTLPVMVYIHGGAFWFGEHPFYSPEELIMHGDVIYVGINYRLSSIGFLTTGDDVAPGNYGLWDQAAALKWVNENIAAFGGDPNTVTVFGQSAGGCSVSHMLISSYSNTLFNRGIVMSGAASALFGTAIRSNALASTNMLASLFACDQDDMEAMIECLRQEDAATLEFWAFMGVVIFHQQFPTWLPVIDGDFLPVHPVDMWANGAADNLDVMAGHLHDDFAGFVLFNTDGNYSEVSEEGGMAKNNESLDFFLHFWLNSFGNPDELADIMYGEYPEMLSDDTLTRTMATAEYGTDWTFGAPSHYESSQHYRTSSKSTYMYDFHYRQSFFEYPDWVEGSHGDELYSVFGEIHKQDYREQWLGEYSSEDHLAKYNTMTYFTNFARTGDPNVGPNSVNVVWEPYMGTTQRSYMILKDAPEMSILDAEKEERYRWYVEEWPQLIEIKEYNETYPVLPVDCEPGLPISDDCLGQILPNFTRPTGLPFPPQQGEYTFTSWDDFEQQLTDGLYDVVELLEEALALSNARLWESFKSNMFHAIAKKKKVPTATLR